MVRVKIQGQRYGTYLKDIRTIIVDISCQSFSINYRVGYIAVKYGMNDIDFIHKGFSITPAMDDEPLTNKYIFSNGKIVHS